MRRDWSDARFKVSEEGRCRLCSATGVKLDAAHLIGRRCDRPRVKGSTTKVLWVNPDSVIPLCHDTVVPGEEVDGIRTEKVRVGCHTRYDAGEVGVLQVLTTAEQVQAVRDAGGIEMARRRLDPRDYQPAIQNARAEQ